MHKCCRNLPFVYEVSAIKDQCHLNLQGVFDLKDSKRSEWANEHLCQ